ncbi:uncharacterized protein [Aegilops tauschii subsp. strangulata]|uniref:uncharacterized protein n=1 Tax=Aegilops tauschii subsp. strangulata TaxID=200361 RepID=UPI003CC8470B
MKCGNVSISDPFWLTDEETGRSCGSDPYPDFDVAFNKCREVVYNTSVKLNGPFRIAPVNLNLILYNCTEEDGAAAEARRDTGLAQTSVRCGSEWAVLVRAGVQYDPTGKYSS